MTTKNLRAYSENDIHVAKNALEGIRMKPSMYIGPIDSHGIWHITKECVDNVVDEYNAGRAKSAFIGFDGDQILVMDDGEGIPVQKHKETKESTLTSILTRLHAGGKLKASDAYKGGSIGTHGVGLKALTALTAKLDVYTHRDGSWWHTSFAKGVETSPVKKVSKPSLILGLKPKSGTAFLFTPDYSCFNKGAKFDTSMALEWAELSSYLNGGLRITVNVKGIEVVYHHPKGVAEYIEHQLKKLKTEALGKTFTLHLPNVDVALTWTTAEGDNMEAYTNSSFNQDGGEHVRALWQSVNKVLGSYAKRGHDFNPVDLREGVVGVVNYKIASPQFSSQTKEKLVDVRVYKECEAACTKALDEFFSKNKKLAVDICNRATELRSARDDFTKSKKLINELAKRAKARNLMPGKFAEVKNCPADKRECFVVEGDSAGGCFVGTTPIMLADGTTITYAEMVTRAENGETFNGIDYNLTTGKQRVFEFDTPRLTKYTTELVEVTLSDGTVHLCTPDHPWLTDTGDYVAAESLTPGTELQTISVPAIQVADDE